MYHHDGGSSPPSDTTHCPILGVFLHECLRADRHVSPDFVFSGQVGDLEPHLLVDGRLDGGLGAADDVAQVAQAGDEGADVVFGEPAAGRLTGLAGVAGERGGALGFDLAGPFGDGLGVGSGVEGCLVAGEPGVAVGDDGVDVLRGRSRDGGGGLLGGLHLADGLLELVRREDGDEPVVDGGQQVRFAEVDVAGVADVAGQGVFPGVSAAVVGFAVAVLALHPASAVPAVQPSAQDVGVSDSLVCLAAPAPGAPGAGHDGLRGLEVPVRDQGLVGDGVGPDPAAGLVPAHPGLVAGGDVVDVQEDLVLALLVPDLPAGVPGVAQDDSNSGFGPAFAGAVPVAGPVVLRRGRDPVAGEALGDGEQAAPGEVLGEDPPDHPGGLGVGFQLVQALAVGGLGRVRVRAG